jgi:lysophospholipase L1-like esterase
MAAGVLALGDSITRKGPWGALGLPDRSWAWFVAQTLELPLTNLAVDGARAADVRREQLPLATGEYALALAYVGVNDARSPEWDADGFAADLDAILATLAAHTPRVLALTIPAGLGRPRAGAKVLAANAIVERAAARHGAASADLSALAGPKLMLPDRVHLTPRGQLAVADIAARALRLDELPSERFPRDRSPFARARYARKYLTDALRARG